mgnify:CR=1 FL=1
MLYKPLGSVYILDNMGNWSKMCEYDSVEIRRFGVEDSSIDQLLFSFCLLFTVSTANGIFIQQSNFCFAYFNEQLINTAFKFNYTAFFLIPEQYNLINMKKCVSNNCLFIECVYRRFRSTL